MIITVDKIENNRTVLAGPEVHRHHINCKMENKLFKRGNNKNKICLHN